MRRRITYASKQRHRVARGNASGRMDPYRPDGSVRHRHRALLTAPAPQFEVCARLLDTSLSVRSRTSGEGTYVSSTFAPARADTAALCANPLTFTVGLSSAAAHVDICLSKTLQPPSKENRMQ